MIKRERVNLVHPLPYRYITDIIMDPHSMWHLPSCTIPIHHFCPALFIFETCPVMWLCPHDQACVLICQLKECIKTFKNTQYKIIGTYKSEKRIKLKALFRTPTLHPSTEICLWTNDTQLFRSESKAKICMCPLKSY